MNSPLFEALGMASMCWNPTPTGVFDADKAAEIGKALEHKLPKHLEVRDSCTCCPLLAIPIVDNLMTKRAGFGAERRILVYKLQTDEFASQPHIWLSNPWMHSVHQYILEHWTEIRDGGLIDMRVIRGEETIPVTSEYNDLLELPPSVGG